MSTYPPLDVQIHTPELQLLGSTDERLDALAPLVAAGKAMAEPAPWDDPHAFYESDPEVRVQRWLQGVWRARGTVRGDAWRLSFVVMVDDQPVGQMASRGPTTRASPDSDSGGASPARSGCRGDATTSSCAVSRHAGGRSGSERAS